MQAAEIYFRLSDLQPFMDANRRVAILIMNYYLMRSHLPPLEINDTNQEEFMRVFRFMQTPEELADFIADQLFKQGTKYQIPSTTKAPKPIVGDGVGNAVDAELVAAVDALTEEKVSEGAKRVQNAIELLRTVDFEALDSDSRPIADGVMQRDLAMWALEELKKKDALDVQGEQFLQLLQAGKNGLELKKGLGYWEKASVAKGVSSASGAENKSRGIFTRLWEDLMHKYALRRLKISEAEFQNELWRQQAIVDSGYEVVGGVNSWLPNYQRLQQVIGNGFMAYMPGNYVYHPFADVRLSWSFAKWNNAMMALYFSKRRSIKILVFGSGTGIDALAAYYQAKRLGQQEVILDAVDISPHAVANTTFNFTTLYGRLPDGVQVRQVIQGSADNPGKEFSGLRNDYDVIIFHSPNIIDEESRNPAIYIHKSELARLLKQMQAHLAKTGAILLSSQDRLSAQAEYFLGPANLRIRDYFEVDYRIDENPALTFGTERRKFFLLFNSSLTEVRDTYISARTVEASLSQALAKLGDGVYEADDILRTTNPIMQENSRRLIAQRLAELFYDSNFTFAPKPEDFRGQVEIYYDFLRRFQTFVAVRSGKILGFTAYYFVNADGKWKIDDPIVGKQWQTENVASELIDAVIEKGILQAELEFGRVLLFFVNPTPKTFAFYLGGISSINGARIAGYFPRRRVNSPERKAGWWLEAKEAPDHTIHAQIYLSESTGNIPEPPNASLPAAAPSDKGGIDFRALPLATQSTVAGETPFVRAQMPLVGRIANDKDWQAIENMLDGGIVPSSERIKDYLLKRCDKGNINEAVGRVLSCIAGILRLEEENDSSLDPRLREFLVLLESDKPLKEFKTAVNNIHFAAKEPSLN